MTVGGRRAQIGLEESLERNTALVDRNAESLESIVIASRSIVSSLDRSAQSIDEQRVRRPRSVLSAFTNYLVTGADFTNDETARSTAHDAQRTHRQPSNSK